MMTVSAIRIRPTDQVATLTKAVAAGEEVLITGVGELHRVIAGADMPAGHKVAVMPISLHEDILKYGEVIGVAVVDIAVGDHVHVHNCRGAKARRFGTA